MKKRIERLRLYISLFVINHFLKGTRFYKAKRMLLNHCKGIFVGENSKIVGPISVFGELTVGCNVWIGRNFAVEGNGAVKIENNCDLAPNITIYTGTHEIGNETRRAGPGISRAVVIKQGSWICGSTIILPNVTIGAGTVVGAGSVVVSDTSDNTLVAGNPAVIKKQLI